MNPYVPLIELTRGQLVESVHYGVVCVTDTVGHLIACVGDPGHVANLRSSAKPFQALSLVEDGGLERFGFSARELAIICASHSGTDAHVAVLRELQARIGVAEGDLQCGVHDPIDEATSRAMRERGEKPTPNRHNCSGKHTGMLANARLRDLPISTYLETSHPLQQVILRVFAEMVGMHPREIPVGIDGCSAPTFAAPMQQVARAYALLADPSSLLPARAAALRKIFTAMTGHPAMVGGPGRFDTLLMQAAGGKLVAKGGAEGYLGIALRPGACGVGSPALGITLKISDGDSEGRAGPAVALEVLAYLGALSPAERAMLEPFDRRALRNWRDIETGELRPAFKLDA